MVDDILRRKLEAMKKADERMKKRTEDIIDESRHLIDTVDRIMRSTHSRIFGDKPPEQKHGATADERRRISVAMALDE